MAWYHKIVDILDNNILIQEVDLFWKGIVVLLLLYILSQSGVLSLLIRLSILLWMILWIYPNIRRIITGIITQFEKK